jgi:hypothetical protein
MGYSDPLGQKILFVSLAAGGAFALKAIPSSSAILESIFVPGPPGAPE